MKLKLDEAEHAPKEEAEHLLTGERNGRSEKKARLNFVTVKDDQQVFDNQKTQTIEQEISWDFNDPEVLRRLNDPEFMKQFDGICIYHFIRSKPPAGYTVDDFKQDMLFHIVKGISQYRSEAKLSTVLFRIARNLRIDLSRLKSCPSIEDLKRKDEEGKDRESAAFEGGELGMRYADTNQNVVADTAERMVLAHELMDKLNDREQSVFFGYFVERKTLDKIGVDLGITRQAVAGQLSRVIKKLKCFVD